MSVQQDRDQWIRDWQEREGRIFANAPTPPPCPSWCTDDKDLQEYSSVDPADEQLFSRTHLRQFGDIVTVTQVETNRAGVVSLLPATIDVDMIADLGTGSEARQLCVRLLEAAVLLDEINGCER